MLSDRDILNEIDNGGIVIEPFDRSCLGSNSYDLHLSNTLFVYNDKELDCAKENKGREIIIPKEGFVLQPNELYLASSIEYTETANFVPYMEGKSSLGRLGMFIHITAGKGDCGFKGFWTMEFAVVKPLRIYAGMPIAQLTYFELVSPPEITYDLKDSQKYVNKQSKPMPSQMWKNKFFRELE